VIVRVDDLIPRIAKIIVDVQGDESWLHAGLLVTAYDENLREYELSYSVPDKAEPDYIDFIDYDGLWDDLDPIYKDMWGWFKAVSSGSWREAHFTLQRSGKASLRFVYPPKDQPSDDTLRPRGPTCPPARSEK